MSVITLNVESNVRKFGGEAVGDDKATCTFVVGLSGFLGGLSRMGSSTADGR